MLKKGYLLFPKVLFEEQIKVTKGATGYFDAFILVLTHVNYSTVECHVHHYTFQCRRGESVISIAHWAELFGWKRSRTRYFSIRCMMKVLLKGWLIRISLISVYPTTICWSGRNAAKVSVPKLTVSLSMRFGKNIMRLPGSLKPISAVPAGNGKSYLSTNVVLV